MTDEIAFLISVGATMAWRLFERSDEFEIDLTLIMKVLELVYSYALFIGINFSCHC
jgi:hypothetical protein